MRSFLLKNLKLLTLFTIVFIFLTLVFYKQESLVEFDTLNKEQSNKVIEDIALLTESPIKTTPTTTLATTTSIITTTSSTSTTTSSTTITTINLTTTIKSKPKLACLILTSEKSILERGPADWETWASECTSTVFACNCSNIDKLKKLNSSEVPDELKKFIPVKDFPFMQLNLIENYDRMAEKVMMVLKLGYERFESYDWFFLADDDTFVFIDNMYRFLEEKSPNELHTYGYNFKVIVKSGYHSGGGGVLFTKAGLKKMHEKMLSNECDFKEGYGDLAVGSCAEIANVTMGNSLDEQGRERFHCLSFEHHFQGFFPDWLLNYASNYPKKGKECCSRYSITFHYTSPQEMRDYRSKFDFKILEKKR